MAATTCKFGILRCVALTAVLCASGASAAPRTRVAVLVEGGASMYQQAARGVEEGLGGVDPLDVVRVDGGPQEIEKDLAGLQKNPPVLIVAIGTQVAEAARQKLPEVPMVYCLALNPAQNHLTGPNVGGVSLEVDLAKELATIEKALPKVRRVGVIYEAATSGSLVREAQKRLRGRVSLVPRAAGSPQEAARLIPGLMGQVDAFWLLWDGVIANPANFKLLVEYSLRDGTALVAPAAPFVEAGALMSVAADPAKAGRRTAEMARLVLEKKRLPGSMVEPAQDTVVTINGRVAKRLGIQIPADLPAEILSQ